MGRPKKNKGIFAASEVLYKEGKQTKPTTGAHDNAIPLPRDDGPGGFQLMKK